MVLQFFLAQRELCLGWDWLNYTLHGQDYSKERFLKWSKHRSFLKGRREDLWNFVTKEAPCVEIVTLLEGGSPPGCRLWYWPILSIDSVKSTLLAFSLCFRIMSPISNFALCAMVSCSFLIWGVKLSSLALGAAVAVGVRRKEGNVQHDHSTIFGRELGVRQTQDIYLCYFWLVARL